MTKQEFVDRLRIALKGNVSDTLVADYVNYYEEYISSEVHKGRCEREVLETLGEPRLIARTIIQTNTIDSEGAGDHRYDNTNTYQQSDSYRQSGNVRTHYEQMSANSKGGKLIRIPGWAWMVLVFLIIILIIWFVMSVLSFLAPIIVPVLLVVFLVKLFRDWLN